MKSIIVSLFFSFCLMQAFAQEPNKDSLYVREHYEKSEHQVTMRDGKKLFTVVYTPKDKSKTWPIRKSFAAFVENNSRYISDL